MNLYTVGLGKESRVLEKSIQVYAVHPGFCDTPMVAGFNATETADDGAKRYSYLANLPFEVNAELQGKFFEKDKIVKLTFDPQSK